PASPWWPEEERKRDLAIAVVNAAVMDHPVPGPSPLPLLQRALSADPDDVDAWEAKGLAEETWGRQREAAAAYDEVLRRQPKRELTLQHAAAAAEQLRNPARAAEMWERLVEINPGAGEYRFHRARFRAQRGDWAGAATEAAEAVKLDPAEVRFRM